MKRGIIINVLLLATVVRAAPRLDNNLKCVDLSDLVGPLPLRAVASRVILKQSEDWEGSSYKNPRWPKGGHGAPAAQADRDVRVPLGAGHRQRGPAVGGGGGGQGWGEGE